MAREYSIPDKAQPCRMPRSALKGALKPPLIFSTLSTSCLIARALENTFKSVHRRLTGLQFLISCRPPFFGRRMITALLQLNGREPSSKVSFRTANQSAPSSAPEGLIKLYQKAINAWGSATLHAL
ncbi:hypothetical protein AOLI_G00221390 [Acnodon oligacanthus]